MKFSDSGMLKGKNGRIFSILLKGCRMPRMLGRNIKTPGLGGLRSALAGHGQLPQGIGCVELFENSEGWLR